jgi:hypothetical protein
VFVLEARPARASFIPTDLGAGLSGAESRVRSDLDPLLADLELRFLMSESLAPSPEAFFSRPYIVLTGDNLPFAGGKLFFGLVRQNGNPLAVAFAERCHQLVFDQGDDGSAHRDSGCVAITLPRRPHRFRGGNPRHLPGLVVAETG